MYKHSCPFECIVSLVSDKQQQQQALNADTVNDHTSALSSSSGNASQSGAAVAPSLQAPHQPRPSTTPSPAPANSAHAPQHPSLSLQFPAQPASNNAAAVAVTSSGAAVPPPAQPASHHGASTPQPPGVAMSQQSAQGMTSSQQQQQQQHLLNSAQSIAGGKLMNGPTSHLPSGILPMKQNPAVSIMLVGISLIRLS